MKNFKKVLLVALAICSFTFVACDDDDDDNKVTNKTAVSTFAGDVYVCENLVASNIDVTLTSKTKKETCDVMMYGVKFSPNMPMTMDMGIEGLSYVVSNGDTIATGSALHPTVGGQAYDSYTFNNVECIYNAESMTISMEVESNHGTMTMSFSGSRK